VRLGNFNSSGSSHLMWTSSTLSGNILNTYIKLPQKSNQLCAVSLKNIIKIYPQQ